MPGYPESIETLADSFTVARFDHRGSGLSPHQPPYTRETFALDLAAVVDEVSPDAPVLLFGLVHGAVSLLTYALAQQQRVRGIALWCPSGTHPSRTPAALAIDAAVVLDLPTAIGALTAKEPPETREVLADYLRAGLDAADPRSYETLPILDDAEALGSLLVPAVVISRHENRINPDDVRRFATLLPNCELVTLPGSSVLFSRDEEADIKRILAGLASDPADPLANPSVPTPDNVDRLTPRELEVLREVALGQRNVEIAKALSISPATVTRHISNILRKTGRSNRTQIARYATEHGLAGSS